jgi:hypothetical protein
LGLLSRTKEGGHMPIRKKLGQLIKEKHWSVMGLAKSLNITKEHIIKWEKLNKQYRKYKR